MVEFADVSGWTILTYRAHAHAQPHKIILRPDTHATLFQVFWEPSRLVEMVFFGHFNMGQKIFWGVESTHPRLLPEQIFFVSTKSPTTMEPVDMKKIPASGVDDNRFQQKG